MIFANHFETAPLNRFIMIRAAYAGDRAAGIAWQAALQEAFSFRSGRETFIVKDYRSMLNFFYSIAKGSGSPPDPNIYYRSTFYKLRIFRVRAVTVGHFFLGELGSQVDAEHRQ